MSEDGYLAMGQIRRKEPEDSSPVESDNHVYEGFMKVGWMAFIRKFHGHNREVTIMFVKSFDGCKVLVGDIKLLLDEDFIATSTGLLNEGERWFKHCQLEYVPWKKLTIKYVDPDDYTKGSLYRCVHYVAHL